MYITVLYRSTEAQAAVPECQMPVIASLSLHKYKYSVNVYTRATHELLVTIHHVLV